MRESQSTNIIENSSGNAKIAMETKMDEGEDQYNI